ncbi:MAG: glycerol-3-phosphate acyltransferase [Mycoplasmoidaceae bacterium]
MDYFILFSFALIFSIIGYLLGSILFGPLFSKRKNIDLKSMGSKNVGATNVTRVLGIKIGALTYLWDSVKSWIAIFLSLLIYVGIKNTFEDINNFTNNAYIIYTAGLFTIIGHCFPIEYLFHLFKNKFDFKKCEEFRGGKGAASTAGFFMAVSPWIFIIAFLMFWIILGIVRYVSVSSILAIIASVIMSLIPNLNFLYMLNLGGDLTIISGVNDSITNFYKPFINYESYSQYIFYVFSMALLMATIVIYKHKENIRRLINKEESKIGKKSK